MKTKSAIGLLCAAAVLAWTGMASAQAAPPTPKLQLPSGETVWDLNGDWDAFLENFGAKARYGIYPHVFRITQTGSEFSAIRLKDNPPPSPGRAGNPTLRGELEKTGFKKVWIVDSGGVPWERKGQVSEDGKKIVLFLPEGRMAVVITGEGRTAPATDQDRVALFNSLVAYTGPCRVDGDTWIATVEVSANPAWVGTEQARAFEISGDRLQGMTAWAARPDNRMARAVITYERAKSRGERVVRRGGPIAFSVGITRASGITSALVEVPHDQRG